jgi:hypothetical protein
MGIALLFSLQIFNTTADLTKTTAPWKGWSRRIQCHFSVCGDGVCVRACVCVCARAYALSLVSTIDELLGRKSSGSGLESREYGHRDPSRWPHGTLYPQKLALTSSTSDGRSVGRVRSRTLATEFGFFVVELMKHQTMKAYGGCAYSSTFLDFGTRWMSGQLHPPPPGRLTPYSFG